MGRDRIFVALAVGATLSFSLATGGFAQVPTQPGTGPAPAGIEPGNGLRPSRQSARRGQPWQPPQQVQAPQQVQPPQQARERWREMSPEDRLRFRSNAERWLQLDPEERKTLRDKEGDRRQRIQRESEDALQKSGLQLEAERREAWERQYLQERRRIERELRQELEEKRQRELGPVMERLKKEFSQGQASSSPAPSGASSSPSPKK